MPRKTLKSGSALSVGSASAVVVVGTFLIRLASFVTALSSVVRHLISSQAASGLLAFLEMPMTFPVTCPPPYLAGWLVGIGAPPYLRFGVWSLRNASRYSASML